MGSGLLVPPGQLPTVKAVTHSSTKWGWLRERTTATWGADVHALRASVGRLGEESLLQIDDQGLIERTVAELRGLPGWSGVELVAGTVQRWGGGLPQYEVGHLELVARLRADAGRAARAGGLRRGVRRSRDRRLPGLGGGGREQDHQRSGDAGSPGGGRSGGMKAREINDTIRYTMWSVFQRDRAAGRYPGEGAPEELAQTALSRDRRGDRGRGPGDPRLVRRGRVCGRTPT